MGVTRRKFTLEFKTEAAHRVIDTGRTIAEVAAELSVVDSSLARWVRDERRRLETVAGSSDEPLSAAERTELFEPAWDPWRLHTLEVRMEHDR